MTIKPIPNNDLDAVVLIHLKAFPDFFLSQLGKSFLYHYYSTVKKMQTGILLGCYDDNGTLMGFSAATTLSSGFHKKVLFHNFLFFGLDALILLFTRPAALIHLIANMTKSPEKGIYDSFQYGELLSIAVSPDNQGKGVGRELICATEKDILEQGQTEISLTTDAINNDKTFSFYKKNGYNILYEFTAYPTRKMFRMNKRLY